MQKMLGDYVSREAYEIKKPEIEIDRDRVYQEIVNNGEITCKELAKKWHCNPNDISGRFTELASEGFIVSVGKKYLANYKGRMYPNTIWSAKI